ncbi:MAG: (2Fe-2S) ferredoxin domain-containing protein [Euryarchaeota archaeon]|nr:(2Fe-2S) ferredoxin domain-containing protein [Euryarchaeota archaeon]
MSAMKGGSKRPHPTRHLFICTHERDVDSDKGSCSAKGSLNLLKKLKHEANNRGLKDVQISRSGCLSRCKFGTTCVIYPEGTWYSVDNNEEDIMALLDHLESGNKSARIEMILD